MTPQQLQDLKDLFSKQYGRLLVLLIIGIIITVGLLIGHRMQQDRHTGSKVDAWHKKYSYLITDFTKDFSTAEVDSKANNLSGLAADCAQIGNDAVRAEHVQKIPDPNIQSYWTAALQSDVVGSELCAEGASEGNNTLMTEANADYNKGTTDLEVVAHDLQRDQQEN